MPDSPPAAYPWDPHRDPRDAVATAGAYFLVDGRFAFMIGPTPDGASLAVVRLGGHREAGETPWQCAEREVLEEAGLRISPRTPPCTYWLQIRDDAPDQEALIDGGWPHQPSTPVPLLIARGRPGLSDRLSAMYLATAEGAPEPLHEAHGLLFLSPAEVVAVLHRRVTLGQYLRSGGHAILRPGLPHGLPLLPHLQLRVLAMLLNRHPELAI
jgi:8-oxo-dGTP pyrophosphatase MutT (NUDIX family)